MPIGLLLLLAWAAIVDDAYMTDQPEASGHPDDEIRHGLVLDVLAHFTCDVVVMQGSSASRRVWYHHEVNEVLACGTFQSIACLACMLVEQPCETAW